jgi:hypothetical protein
MRRLSELAGQHEALLTAGLSAEQRSDLRTLLATVAEHQGLTPRVHPGYQSLGRPTRT